MRNSLITRLGGAVATIALLLSFGTSSVLAKEGVSVSLSAPLPGDAAPGTIVAAFFTMEAISDDVASPLRKASVFMRLYGPGGAMTEAAGVEQTTPGLYKAMIEIPTGGIARGEFGIHGQAKTSTGKVVATDVVWSYDGLLVIGPVPPAADPGTGAVAGVNANPAEGGTSELTKPLTPAPTTSDVADQRLGAVAVLVLAAIGGAGLLVGGRRRLLKTAA